MLGNGDEISCAKRLEALECLFDGLEEKDEIIEAKQRLYVARQSTSYKDSYYSLSRLKLLPLKYHKDMYEEATPHMQVLFHDENQDRKSHAMEINNQIEEYNIRTQTPARLGIIDMALTHAIQEDHKDIERICKEHQYPLCWTQEEGYGHEYSADMYWTRFWNELTPSLNTFWWNLIQGQTDQQFLKDTHEQISSRLEAENMRRDLPCCLYKVYLEDIFEAYAKLSECMTERNRGGFYLYGSGYRRNVEYAIILSPMKINMVAGHVEIWCTVLMEALEQPANESEWCCLGCSARVHGRCITREELEGVCPACNWRRPENLRNNTSGENREISQRIMSPQAPVTASGLNQGQRLTRSIPPRGVTRVSRPGFTAMGEKIIACRERFGAIVEKEDKSHEFLTMNEAGGKPVINAATAQGLPTIEKVGWENTIYPETNTISWVAVDSWDPFGKKLPKLASLRRLFGTAIEGIVAESICGNNALSVEEALEQLFGVSHEERMRHWAAVASA
ncbi:hypothetical protein ACJ73_09518 [Blastomyces percursus]|uniref:Uncharacterized protein n=1 Tax=Blastomyces percursus TaxID=1658174 RepID=A0A1J9P5Y5_9EURO|nr:hypothetical protein ACJ73_09518 [Blastomyces percursus]